MKANTATPFTRSGKEYAYVIRRPLSSVVVCGGANQANMTHAEVDSGIVEDEIRREHRLVPGLVSAKPEISDNAVGIRPARKNGYRIEKEKFNDNRDISFLQI